ncbi:hypothetical protein BRADI_5g26958v3 [Brachypodium distachyon]|uniref:Uncharacterized protein n=1 Tax=Brachypodium distachyon TaxID=15368 RepID=A0A0Q3ECJ1_BRADI|nr:hypothetical protein BRADI_5g26958v3 [Brachypodium distachyon]
MAIRASPSPTPATWRRAWPRPTACDAPPAVSSRTRSPATSAPSPPPAAGATKPVPATGGRHLTKAPMEAASRYLYRRLGQRRPSMTSRVAGGGVAVGARVGGVSPLSALPSISLPFHY